MLSSQSGVSLRWSPWAGLGDKDGLGAVLALGAPLVWETRDKIHTEGELCAVGGHRQAQALIEHLLHTEPDAENTVSW